MNIKRVIKKLLILLREKIAQYPLLKNFSIRFLSRFPKLYNRLKYLNTYEIETEKKIPFSSYEAKKIFDDINKKLQKQELK